MLALWRERILYDIVAILRGNRSLVWHYVAKIKLITLASSCRWIPHYAGIMLRKIVDYVSAMLSKNCSEKRFSGADYCHSDFECSFKRQNEMLCVRLPRWLVLLLLLFLGCLLFRQHTKCVWRMDLLRPLHVLQHSNRSWYPTCYLTLSQ